MFDIFDESEYKDASLAKIEQSAEVMAKLHPWFMNPKFFLFWLSKPGNGKTYFGAALRNYWKETSKSFRSFTEHQFFSELKKCIPQGWDCEKEAEKYADCDYLIFDDLGSTMKREEEATEWKQNMLFTLIDIRYANHKPLFLTTNLTHDELNEKFQPRFISRLFAARNTIIETNGPDRRQDKQ